MGMQKYFWLHDYSQNMKDKKWWEHHNCRQLMTKKCLEAIEEIILNLKRYFFYHYYENKVNDFHDLKQGKMFFDTRESSRNI